MVATPFALFLAFAQRPKDQYTLGVQGGTFVVRDGAKEETVSQAVSEAKPKDFLSFRADKRWAVWDARGLTTRDGEWTFTDRLEAAPTSPRVQERDAIKATLAKVKAGERRLAAGGLSGARRIGGVVYLLVRWDDAGRKPWLEALLAVDLAKPHPKARLLGTFAGLSLGQGVVDERLGIDGGRLAVAVNAPEAWGLATYDPKTKGFGFEARGTRLVALARDWAIQDTGYGTRTVGPVGGDPELELRGAAEFVPGEGPILVRAGSRLHNAETGAEFRLARNAAIRRTSAGLLVFWPASSPRSARLLDPDRLEERARWERGTKRSRAG